MGDQRFARSLFDPTPDTPEYTALVAEFARIDAAAGDLGLAVPLVSRPRKRIGGQDRKQSGPLVLPKLSDDAVPVELRAKRDPAQIFHEVLEHWYYQSTIEGKDMDLPAAARSYVDTVLRFVPDERTPTVGPDDETLDEDDEWPVT